MKLRMIRKLYKCEIYNSAESISRELRKRTDKQSARDSLYKFNCEMDQYLNKQPFVKQFPFFTSKIFIIKKKNVYN